MKIAIASDHRGFDHKQRLVDVLEAAGHEVADFGGHGPGSIDYPDPALPAAEAVARAEADAGILICGSGIGMSIIANKVQGIRASLCFTVDQARTTRQHNDSNVICLSGDGIDPATAVALVEAWLAAEFEAGRHALRVDKIVAYENAHMNQE